MHFLKAARIRVNICEGRKELAHTMVRLQLIYSLKELAHFCSEHLLDFSTYLLHRFIASLAQ
jgi:hypothetical protein